MSRRKLDGTAARVSAPRLPGPAGGGADGRPIFTIHTDGKAERRPGEGIEDALRRAFRVIRRGEAEATE